MNAVSDTYKHPAPALHIKARSDGMFVIFDRDQRQRYKALTREAAQQWIAAELARRPEDAREEVQS